MPCDPALCIGPWYASRLKRRKPYRAWVFAGVGDGRKPSDGRELSYAAPFPYGDSRGIEKVLEPFKFSDKQGPADLQRKPGLSRPFFAFATHEPALSTASPRLGLPLARRSIFAKAGLATRTVCNPGIASRCTRWETTPGAWSKECRGRETATQRRVCRDGGTTSPRREPKKRGHF